MRRKDTYIPVKFLLIYLLIFGYDNFCSYCVVPYTIRNREQAREIIEEELKTW